MALPEILLLVGGEERTVQMVRSSGIPSARLRVLRWDRVRGEDLNRRELRAVVFQPTQLAADRKRRAEILRMVPEGVARVFLQRAGQGDVPRPRRGAADLHLAAPVDLRLLTSILKLNQRCRQLEESYRRSR